MPNFYLPQLLGFNAINKYLAIRLITMFIMVLLAVFFLFFLIEYIDHLRRASGRSQATPMEAIYKMVIYHSINDVSELLPYVVLIANILCFYRLNINQEIIIMRACGYSTRQLLSVPLWISLVIGLVYLSIINPISAKLNEYYYKLNNQYFGQQTTTLSLLKDNIWLREFQDENNQIIIINAKNSQNQAKNLENVDIYIQSEQGSMEQIIHASSAELVNNSQEPNPKLQNYWLLKNGIIENIGEKIGDTINPFNEYKMPTTIHQDSINGSILGADTISVYQLYIYAGHLAGSGFNAAAYYIRFYALLTLPINLVAMQMIGMGFAMKNQLRVRKLSLIFYGILTGFLVFFSTQIIFAYGQIYKLPNILVGVIPAIIAFVFGLYFLLYHED